MKTLNYLVAGMIGLGSLGIFGSEGYGQEILEEYHKSTSLKGMAEYINHQKFQIEVWREFDCGRIVLNKYFDTNYDGEIDSMSILSYSLIDNQISKENLPDSLYSVQTFLPRWIKKNLPLGKNFTNCEEGFFKKNIQDYVK